MPSILGGMVAENSAVCRLRGVAEDLLDVLGEAHVEHLVRFIEDDDLKAAQLQRSPVDVVERAPGVATTTSTPRLSARNCRADGSPP